MLPAQYRMRRSKEFDATVRHGVAVSQPDLVVYRYRVGGGCGVDGDRVEGPRIGLIVSKSVGSAVQRHLVARRLRHAARGAIVGLDPSERVVIRALPSTRDAVSARLEQQLLTALRCTPESMRASG